MCGSCSLIGLKGLADSAALLEHFSSGAGLLMKRTLEGASEMREAALLVRRSTTVARSAHNAPTPEEAQRVTQDFVTLVTALITHQPQPATEAPASGELSPAAEAPSEAPVVPAYDFDDAPQTPAPEGEPSQIFQFGFDSGITSESGSDDPSPALPSEEPVGLDQELLQFFQEEAQQAVVPLTGYLVTLRQDRKRLDVVANLEKLSSHAQGLVGHGRPAADHRDVGGTRRPHGARARRAARRADRDRRRLRRGADALDQRIARGQRSAAAGRVRARREPRARHGDSAELRRIFLQEADGICVEVAENVQEGRTARRGPGQRDRPPVPQAQGLGRAQRRRPHRRGLVAHAGSVRRTVRRRESVRAVRQRVARHPRRARAYARRDRGARVAGLRSRSGERAQPSQRQRARRRGTSRSSAKRSRSSPTRSGKAFEIESVETLEAMDRDVVELESTDQPKECLRKLFRAYHTLKGAANTVGLSPLGPHAAPHRGLPRSADRRRDAAAAEEHDALPALGAGRHPRQLEASAARLHRDLPAAARRRDRSDPVRPRSPSFTSEAASRAMRHRFADAHALGHESQRSQGTRSKGSTGFVDADARAQVHPRPGRAPGIADELTGEVVIDRRALLRRVMTLRNLQRDLVNTAAA
jgi:hypothetical protein